VKRRRQFVWFGTIAVIALLIVIAAAASGQYELTNRIRLTGGGASGSETEFVLLKMLVVVDDRGRTWDTCMEDALTEKVTISPIFMPDAQALRERMLADDHRTFDMALVSEQMADALSRIGAIFHPSRFSDELSEFDPTMLFPSPTGPGGLGGVYGIRTAQALDRVVVFLRFETGEAALKLLKRACYQTEDSIPQTVADPGGPYEGVAGTPIHLNGSGSIGSERSYQWSFGDGAQASVERPTNTYRSHGTYTVVLTVTGRGGTDTATTQAVVSQRPQPDLSVTVSGHSPATLTPDTPATIALTVSNTGDEPSQDTILQIGRHRFDLSAMDNGETRELRLEIPPVTDFSAPFEVRVDPDNDILESNENNNTTFLALNGIRAVARLEARGTVNQTTMFSAVGSQGTISEYNWDFGDGTTDRGRQVSTTYRTSGAFDVVLTVRSEDGRAHHTDVLSVTIDPEPLPELEVSNARAELANGGRAVRVLADVVNRGTGDSPSTTASASSAGATLESGPTPSTVRALRPGESTTASVLVDIPYGFRDQEHQFTLAVEPILGEARTDNNRASTASIRVPHLPPDLAITSATAELVDEDQTVLIVAEVRNLGEGPAPSTSLHTVDVSPGILALLFGPRTGWANSAAETVDELLPNRAQTVELRLEDIPYEERDHDHVFTIIVDQVPGDANRDNNQLETSRLPIPHLPPDLRVIGAVARASSDIETVEIEATIENIGEGPAEATSASADSSGATWGEHEDGVRSLDPGESQQVRFSLNIPDEKRGLEQAFLVRVPEQPGGLDTEFDEAETPRIPIPNYPPDLSLESPSATLNDDGQTITVTAKIRNRGDGPAEPTAVTLSGPGWQEQSESLEALESGQEREIGFELAIDDEQRDRAHAFTLFVEPLHAETNTVNNGGVTNSLFIEPHRPDLVVLEPVVSVNAVEDRVTMLCTVENVGEGSSEPTTATASADMSVWETDSDSVEGLLAQGHTEISLDLPIPPEARGREHVFVVRVAPVENEMSEENNVATSRAFIPHAPPDLDVSDVVATLVGEELVEVEARIRNLGEGPAEGVEAAVSREAAAWPGESRALGEMTAGSERRERFAFDIPDDWRGRDHVFAVHATSATREVAIGNNAGTAPLFIPHLPPNLAVTETEIEPTNGGRSVTLTIVVANLGRGPSDKTTLRVHSTVAEWWQGSIEILVLGRGQTESVRLELPVPDSVRGSTHAFEARLDPVPRDTNPGDDAGTTPPIEIPPRRAIPPGVWPLIGLGGAAGAAGSVIGIKRLAKRRFRRKCQREDATEKEPEETCKAGTTHCKRTDTKFDPKPWEIINLRAANGKDKEELEAPALAKRKLNEAIASARKKVPVDDLKRQLETAARVLLRWAAGSPGNAHRGLAVVAELSCGKVESEFELYKCKTIAGVSGWKKVDEWKATLKAEREEPVADLQHVQEEASEQRRDELTSTLAEFAQRMAKLRLRLRDAKLEVERED